MAKTICSENHSDCKIEVKTIHRKHGLSSFIRHLVFFPAFSSPVALAALIMLFAGLAERAIADEFVTLQNYDLPGNDLRTPAQDPKLKQISFADCQLVCLVEEKCSAFTYNYKANWCFLKDGTPEPIPFGDTISGVRASRQTETTKALVALQNSSKQVRIVQQVVSDGSNESKKFGVAAAPAAQPAGSSSRPTPSVSSLPAQRANDPKQTIARMIAERDALKQTALQAGTAPLPKKSSAMAKMPAAPQTSVVARSAPAALITIPEPPAALKKFAVESVTTISKKAPVSPNTQQAMEGPKQLTAQKQFKTEGTKPAEASPSQSVMKKEPFMTASGTPSPVASSATAELPATPIPIAKSIATSAALPSKSPVKTATLAAPAAAPAGKPFIEVNKDAKSLHTTLLDRMKLVERARKLSDKYLSTYDAEKAGTKWIKISSLGMTVPMSVNTQQAKAIILSKMRKDEKLEALLQNLYVIEKKASAPFTRIVSAFKPEMREKLTALHDRKLKASEAFRAANSKLRAYGGRLSKRVNDTWKMPSATAIKRLHALAGDMRKHRIETLAAGKDFSIALIKELESPVVTQTF